MKRRVARKVFLRLLRDRATAWDGKCVYSRRTIERALGRITVGEVTRLWRFGIRIAQPLEPIRPGGVRL